MRRDRDKQRVALFAAAALWLMGLCGMDSVDQPRTALSTPISSLASAATLVAVPASSHSLSGAWRFAIDPAAVGQTAGWFEPDFDDAAWAAVTVPHTWNVMPEHAHYAGLAWYRRRFVTPAAAPEAHLRLRFEAVFYIAQVWLNGVYLGAHEGGYTPFEFDVRGVVKPGAENLLAVQVDNRRAVNRIPATLRGDWSFDWWNYGGIVRDVWLHATSRASIAQQRVVAVPHLVAAHAADSATITATIRLRNTAPHAVDGVLAGEVIDDTGGRSALASAPALPVTLPPGEQVEVQLATVVSQPTLWHFDQPHLYRWVAVLRTADGDVLHTAAVRFGIRTVELKEARLYLNGEPVRLVGLTRHADSPAHGLAETVPVMAADYADLKTLNTVLTRPVHYPQAEFIMEYADRAGILLIPEVPAWQLTAAQMADPHMRALEQQQLHEMITTQWNHPSVWAWSVGNEVESRTSAGHEFIRDMIAYAKALDPTRPVGFASNRLKSDPAADATALADFIMMNQYFGTWDGPKDGLGPALDAIHITWPDKPIIISRIWVRAAVATLVEAAYPHPLAPLPASRRRPRRCRRRRCLAASADRRAIGRVAAEAVRGRGDLLDLPGLPDAHRLPHGGGRCPTAAARVLGLLREEYAPALIDAVTVAPPSARLQSAEVVLRTRGPLESDMPAYTLRGYRLHWVVSGSADGSLLSEGEVALPTLAPGTTWSAPVEWPAPAEDYVLTVRLVRPTGFVVLERAYDSRGNPRHPP